MTPRGPTRLLGNDVGPLSLWTKLNKGHPLSGSRAICWYSPQGDPLHVRGGSRPSFRSAGAPVWVHRPHTSLGPTQKRPKEWKAEPRSMRTQARPILGVQNPFLGSLCPSCKALPGAWVRRGFGCDRPRNVTGGPPILLLAPWAQETLLAGRRVLPRSNPRGLCAWRLNVCIPGSGNGQCPAGSVLFYCPRAFGRFGAQTATN